MLQLLKSTKKFNHSPINKKDQGFALTEVIVATLISFLFLAGSLQAIVLATFIRVQAQEKQLSNQGIQEDIENLKSTAENLARDDSLCSATNFADGYAQALITAHSGATYQLDQPFFGYTMRLNRDYLGDGRLIDGTTGTTTELQQKRNTDLAESSPPHRVLKVRYVTQSIKNGTTTDVTEHYVEVIPNAALQCP